MMKLKNKIQLKIKIPTQEQNVKQFIKVENNNRNIISQITDNIYIGGYLIAQDLNYLEKNFFTHVINCSLGSSFETSKNESAVKREYNQIGIKYLSIYLRDAPDIDIIYHLYKIIDFIESDKKTKNKKILFHCIEGISRAPAMVIGYLMWKENIPFSRALDFIKSKRQNVDINLGFNIQLEKWENYLNSAPDKILIFKLNQNMRLLEDEEKQLDFNDKYLIKNQYKYYYINLKTDNINNGQHFLKNRTEHDNNNYAIFTIFKDKTKEFIKNAIKYDKKLLKNDFSSLIEIS